MIASYREAPGEQAGRLLVFAVVPLPVSAGGDGELLALPLTHGWTLPYGTPEADELLFDAAARIVQEYVGVGVRTERLLYFLESAGLRAWAVLCEPLLDDAPEEINELASFLDPRAVPDLEPRALRELLIEDIGGGFLRPVAHVVEGAADGHVTVNW